MPPPPPHSPGNNVINDTAYCAVAMTQKPSPPTSPTVIGPSTHNQKNTSGFKPPLACIEIAWVAQKVEGEGEGEKHPLPFSPFPIPYPFRRLLRRLVLKWIRYFTTFWSLKERVNSKRILTSTAMWLALKFFFLARFQTHPPPPPPPHPPFYKPSWNSLRICLSPGITSGSLL